MAIGFEFVAAIVGFAAIGYLIDWWRGSGHFWTLCLTILGMIGGSYNLYKEVKKLQSRPFQRSVRPDSGVVDPKAAVPEVAARRGKPRPTGKVDLFNRQEIEPGDLDGVELDWPEEERDRIEQDLRRAGDFGSNADSKDQPR